MSTAKLRSILLAMTLAQGAAAFTAADVTAQEAVLPATGADHEALAKKYRDEAAGHRKSAAEHKKMADAYAKSHYAPKTGENPWTVKMQKHCAALVQDYVLLTTTWPSANARKLRNREICWQKTFMGRCR